MSNTNGSCNYAKIQLAMMTVMKAETMLDLGLLQDRMHVRQL